MANYNVDASTSNNFPQTLTFKVESCKEIPNPYLAKKETSLTRCPTPRCILFCAIFKNYPKNAFQWKLIRANKK